MSTTAQWSPTQLSDIRAYRRSALRGDGIWFSMRPACAEGKVGNTIQAYNIKGAAICNLALFGDVELVLSCALQLGKNSLNKHKLARAEHLRAEARTLYCAGRPPFVSVADFVDLDLGRHVALLEYAGAVVWEHDDAERPTALFMHGLDHVHEFADDRDVRATGLPTTQAAAGRASAKPAPPRTAGVEVPDPNRAKWQSNATQRGVDGGSG